LIGQSIAHYRVTAKLGSGGMGEVYRATDSKLGRDVALKVLPPSVVQDVQHMQRFQREAQLLASLNHPNIAAIYGLEHHDRVQALAMELVDGPTLAERISAGAVPLHEALPIARQIAEALEYAHEKGIIHRDLKPANVKLTSGGAVKVLDFGLAKALRDDAVPVDVSNSPTLSLAATKAGLVLGTAAYMSPEQARGKQVDRRADIWSFGAVLYEMLSGARAFPGEDASETLATVIKDQPDWSKLPAGTPRHIERLLRRCLAKDPRQRLQAIGDARLELDESSLAAEESAPGAAVPAPRSAYANVFAGAMAIAALALGAALAWNFKPAPASPPQVRVAELLRTEDMPNTPTLRIQGLVAFSPDGAKFVLATQRGLLLRSLDLLESALLPGTEGAASPFFSPDNRWIGFQKDGQLRKIPVAGGAVTAICASGPLASATWGPDNSILIGGTFAGILRVSPGGGTPAVIVSPQPGRIYLRPRALPDGKSFLYLRGLPGNRELWEIVQQSFGKDDATVVMRGANDAVYVPSGHLVYAQGTDLFAIAYDPKSRKTRGEAVALAQNVSVSTGLSTAHFAVSNTGTLAYIEDRDSIFRSRLVAVDRLGKAKVLTAEVRDYSDPRVSPDGRMVAVHLQDDQNDVWVADIARGTITRLSYDPGEDETPAWSPDGRWVAWAATRADTPRGIYRRRADGSGAEELLWKAELHTHLREWLADGKTMVIEQLDAARNTDILLLEVGEKPSVRVFLQTPFNERNSRVSPDGRWIVYTSDESGRDEIYLQSFPEPGGKMQVSASGGNEAVWSRDGRTIYFRAEGSIQAVDFRAQPRPSVGKPEVLFAERFESPQTGGHTGYDALPGGGLLMIQSAESQGGAAASRSRIIFVFNLLKR
jgi:hypothetical protein